MSYLTVSYFTTNSGFDVLPMEMDLESRTSIQNLIAEAQKYDEIMMLVSAAGFV